MIDLIVKDLDKEMTEGKTSEKDSQKDYETMMVDAKRKRASDSKAVAEKEGAKANTESEAQAHTDGKDAATSELAAHAEYIHALHAECDWLVEHHQVRKDARTSEVEPLRAWTDSSECKARRPGWSHAGPPAPGRSTSSWRP